MEDIFQDIVNTVIRPQVSYRESLVQFGVNGVPVRYKGTAGDLHRVTDEIIREREEIDEQKVNEYMEEREDEADKWGER